MGVSIADYQYNRLPVLTASPSIDIDAEKLLSDICDTRESLNSRQTLSTSPFDFFHYFNTEQAQDAINCHEHVDPGTRVRSF